MRSYTLFVVLLVSLFPMVSCGGGGNSAPPPPVVTSNLSHLYVVNSGDSTIGVEEISPSGQLSSIQNSVPAGVASPSGIALSPVGALYLGSAVSPSIATFFIDPKTGKLTAGQVVPAPGTNLLSWNYAGKLALCGSLLVSFGDSFSDPQHTGVPTRFGWGGSDFTVSSSGSIAFGYQGFFGFGVGDPAPSNTSAAPDSSCSLIFHASQTNNQIVAAINDTLNHVGGGYALAEPVGTSPAEITTDAGFKFLYSANTGSNNVSAFTINKSAVTLSPITGSPYSTGAQPTSLLVVGSWLYVANAADNSVSAFSIDSTTGSLSPVSGSPFSVGTNPSAMVSAGTDLSHSPTGLLLYVSNRGSGNISGFVVTNTGALQSINGSPFPSGNGPAGMSVAAPSQ